MLVEYGCFFGVNMESKMDGYDISKFKNREYCNNLKCRTNSAVPIGFVKENGKSKVLLKCNKCGNSYTIGLDVYSHKYFPTTTGRMHIPSKINGGVPAHIQKQRDQRSKDIMDEYLNTPEKKKNYEEYIEKSEIEHKKFMADFKANYERKCMDSSISKASETRKELIAQGILKFDKKRGCLINTETNEIVKL